MINKKNFVKILWLYSALSIILVLFSIFQVQYDGLSIANSQVFSISLLNPIYDIINTNCSANLALLINNILTLNIGFYVFVCLPFGLYNWISDILHFGGKK